ncbi:MAG: DUF4347 domain-containing protein [Burkholderiaceae bacterium]|nr:MAG: DUF4347 domain-containing protein [Burkholderiaceae bacterium]
MRNMALGSLALARFLLVGFGVLLALLMPPAFAKATGLSSPSLPPQEILFIEDDLPDLEVLRQGARPGMEVVMLDARADGLRQMAQALRGRRGLQALHLIAHGAPGQVNLGSMALNLQTIADRQNDLAAIRKSLAESADILIYGCEVAQGEAGQDFVVRLSQVTGGRIAASANLVGAEEKGGNWILGYSTAPIHSSILEYPLYQGVFPSVAGTFTPNVSTSQPTPGTSASIYYDGLLGTSNIPNVEYDLFYANASTSAIPSGYVAPYVATTPPGPIFTHADNSTVSSDNGVAQLVIKSHDGTAFKLSQFDWQDPSGCNSKYTAAAYLGGLSQGSYSFTITQSGTFSATLSPGSFFNNVNEIRITAAAGASGVCGDVLMGEGIANIVFDDPVNTDATLYALSTSAGTLVPSFAAGTTSYTIAVPNTTAALTVTPTTTNGAATVAVNGTPVSSGQASGSIPLNVGSNSIPLAVKSSDGTTTKTYTVTVTRAAPSVATLSSLSLSSGTLNPVFASGTTGYAASVPNNTTSIAVTPTATDAGATITVNGTTVASGSASGNISLNVGANTITTVVTAQDGTTTQVYTVTVTRAASSVATLSGLGLSSGTLSPAFAPATTSYSASVSNATTSVAVTPTVSDASATVKVNGTTVASGSASGGISLNVGSNTITTVVTAQDGTTTQTYTVTVTRAASSVATLSGLGLSSGTLSPAFATATTSYTVSVPNATTSVTVTPTASDATATVKVNGSAVASGSASGGISLNVGSNTITTVVTAQDGSTTQTYTVTVTRAASSVATLSQLAVSSGTLSPSFASGTTSYTASVSNATSSITVTPTVTDAAATVKVNGTAVASGSASGAISLSIGANTVTTVVTAQDGTTTQTYTVTVTRATSSVATLSGLGLSNGTLSPAFAAATTSYTASVPNAVTSVTVTPTVSDAAATIKVNGSVVASGSASGAVNLNVGANTITTVVTAQDGTTTQTYTVTVTRAASSVATLSGLGLSSGTLSPGFATATTSYSASVPNATASVAVTPLATDGTATIKVNGTAVSSGSASASIALNVGANTITAVVTAQDGVTTQAYAVTVTRADVTGQCGGAAGVGTAFPPSGGALCSAGTATLVTASSGNWSWSCTGGAATASCTAPWPETPTHSGPASATVSSTNGWVLDSTASNGFVPASSVGGALPAGYAFPHGLLSFKLISGSPNSTAQVVVTYPSPLPAGAVYWKYGPTTLGGPSHWYAFPGATIAGNTVTLSLTDQGAGDSDLATPQSIVDPGGVGVPGGSGVRSVPTLSEGAYAVLAIILMVFGAHSMRRWRKGR